MKYVQMTLDVMGPPEQVGGVHEAQTLSEKIEESKKILRLAADMSKAYYGQPLIIAYSGGKDSQVQKWIRSKYNDDFT